MNVEEYFEGQKFQFYGFIMAARIWKENEKWLLEEFVAGSKESNLYGQVYSRRNNQKAIQYYVSLNPPLDETSPSVKEVMPILNLKQLTVEI